MLLPSVLPAHATTYVAGVTVGQWASYSPLNVTYRETGTYFPEPQSVKDLNNTVIATLTVQHLYSATNVTLQSVTLYKNATTRTEILNGDLMTGAGNLSYTLIAGGLSSPDPIWTMPYAPTINFTVPMTYLGVSRTVNIYNFTASSSSIYGSSKVSLEFVWDQASGIVLEAKTLIVVAAPLPFGGFVQYADIQIQATNILPPPTPDFQIAASPPAAVDAGQSTTSTITITPKNGFTGTVTLSDTPLPTSLNCQPINPATLPGTGSATLSCSSSTPAMYTVTVTGTSGSLTHTATASFDL